MPGDFDLTARVKPVMSREDVAGIKERLKTNVGGAGNVKKRAGGGGAGLAGGLGKMTVLLGAIAAAAALLRPISKSLGVITRILEFAILPIIAPLLPLMESLTNLVVGIIDFFRNPEKVFKGLVNSIVNALKGLVNSIVNALKRIANSIIEFVNDKTGSNIPTLDTSKSDKDGTRITGGSGTPTDPGSSAKNKPTTPEGKFADFMNPFTLNPGNSPLGIIGNQLGNTLADLSDEEKAERSKNKDAAAAEDLIFGGGTSR